MKRWRCWQATKRLHWHKRDFLMLFTLHSGFLQGKRRRRLDKLRLRSQQAWRSFGLWNHVCVVRVCVCTCVWNSTAQQFLVQEKVTKSHKNVTPQLIFTLPPPPGLLNIHWSGPIPKSLYILLKSSWKMPKDQTRLNSLLTPLYLARC